MSSYTVTGAGTTSVNGTYVEDGVYGGQPCYQNENGIWLFWNSFGGYFCFDPTKHTGTNFLYICNRDHITGNWIRGYGANPGQLPVPTVSEITFTYSWTLTQTDNTLEDVTSKYCVSGYNGLEITGSLTRSDSAAIGATSLEYYIDDVLIDTEVISAAATSVAIHFDQTINEIATLSNNNHTFKAQVKDSGGTALTSSTLSFDVVGYDWWYFAIYGDASETPSDTVYIITEFSSLSIGTFVDSQQLDVIYELSSSEVSGHSYIEDAQLNVTTELLSTDKLCIQYEDIGQFNIVCELTSTDIYKTILDNTNLFKIKGVTPFQSSTDIYTKKVNTVLPLTSTFKIRGVKYGLNIDKGILKQYYHYSPWVITKQVAISNYYYNYGYYYNGIKGKNDLVTSRTVKTNIVSWIHK